MSLGEKWNDRKFKEFLIISYKIPEEMQFTIRSSFGKHFKNPTEREKFEYKTDP